MSLSGKLYIYRNIYIWQEKPGLWLGQTPEAVIRFHAPDRAHIERLIDEALKVSKPRKRELKSEEPELKWCLWDGNYECCAHKPRGEG